jgi:hypothetical protein
VDSLLHRALHALGVTVMFNRLTRSLDDAIRDNDPIVRDRHTPPRSRRKREPSETSGSRDSLLSSVASASLHSQLDALLHARWLPGRWVQRVWMLSDLPPCLEQRARSIASHAIWRAYTDGARLWFAVAAAAVSTYGRSAIALEVLFFENDGALCSGGLWRCHPNGEWRLERLMGMSSEARFY